MKSLTKTLLAASSLLSLADARQELFMESATTELDEQQMMAGVCQVFLGSDLYDLQGLDELGRNKKEDQPAVSEAGSGSFFFYKICQPSWGLKEESFKLSGSSDPFPEECGKTEASAFLFADGKCPYTFDDPYVDAIKGTIEGKETSVGFTLDFKSQQKCEKDESKNFEVKFTAKCLSVGDNKIVLDQTEDCSVTYNYEGLSACKLTSIPIDEYMQAISPFIGALLIALGLVMTFFGAKFMLYLFTALVGLFVTVVIFCIIYNLFLTSENATMIVIWVVLAVSGALGGIVAKYTTKFADQYSIPLLAAYGGVVLVLQLLNVFGVANIWIEIVACIAAGGAGFYLGKMTGRLIKCMGTAFVGAFFLTKGASFYIEGLPSGKDGDLDDKNPLFWYFIGAFIGLTLVGGGFQLYQNKPEKEEGEGDDNYQKQ